MKDKEYFETDCVVVGGGLSGCVAALELAEAGKKVSLFVKKRLREDSNSYLLAGGVAAVHEGDSGNGDNCEAHIKNTFSAGKGLNDEKIVDFSIKNFYPGAIKWLIDRGVLFDKKDGGYSLHKEGGHSHERVFHVQDITGRAIMEKLIDLVLEKDNIFIYENYSVVDVLTKKKSDKNYSGEDYVLGVYVYDEEKKIVKTFSSRGVFLATGSLGKIFLYTSNSDVATGDGFAMAYRMGLPLANMEFIQFHPTVFYDPNLQNESERRFLLTEALRGSGAILKNAKDSSEDFVLRYSELGSKSTRDIVTRAEDLEMREKGLSHVWLDCTPIGGEKIKNEFSNSYEFCLSKGYDITKEAIPVVYAVHYSNGGGLVDEKSETSVKGCYVIGETSYTGLHGATRLASNSGSECVLFARVATKDFVEREIGKGEKAPLWNTFDAVEIKDLTVISYYWEVVRRTMTTLCGVARNKERLLAAKNVLIALKEEVRNHYWNYKITKDFLEVRNILDVALVVLESALFREESRASHYREDFPEPLDDFLGVSIVQDNCETKLKKGVGK